MLFRSKPHAGAAGFPSTDRVDARRLRLSSDWLRPNGAVVLRNGSNLFTVDVAQYTALSVRPLPGGDAGFHVVGTRAGSDRESVLAKFGSEKAALNALDALAGAFAGLRTKTGGWLKMTAGAFGVFSVVVVLNAAIAPVQANSGAQAQTELSAQRAQARQPSAPAPAGQAAPSGFNPNEPTLEDLAAGKYQFTPKLQAPQVAMPTLNCADPFSK